MTETNDLIKMVKEFKAAPFLFIGSGFSRRYIGTPDWVDLLKHFASVIEPKRPLSFYITKAKQEYNNDVSNPAIASVMGKYFNDYWYETGKFDNSPVQVIEDVVENNYDPFHAELGEYFRNFKVLSGMEKELELFKNISIKSIAGIITTNYDTLIEDTIDEYKIFESQSDMIASSILNVAEVYKIHGTAKNSKSIVIDLDDYEKFNQKMPYLSAKLITLFLENPIIFLGYSITDKNIQEILKQILFCYKDSNLDSSILFKQFIFIDYKKDYHGFKIEDIPFIIDSEKIPMKLITLSDYSLIYSALLYVENKIPVRFLRHFKEKIVQFVVDSKPSKTIKVGNINDSNLNPEALICYLGQESEISNVGYKGITLEDWYNLIVFDSSNYNSNDLLQYTYPLLQANAANKVPAWKFLSQTSISTPDYIWAPKSFKEVLPRHISKTKNNSNIINRSVKGIINDYPDDLYHQTYYLRYLKENEINIDDLKQYLENIMKEKNVFSELSKKEGLSEKVNNKNVTTKTYLRAVIKIFDYLAYYKKEQ